MRKKDRIERKEEEKEATTHKRQRKVNNSKSIREEGERPMVFSERSVCSLVA